MTKVLLLLLFFISDFAHAQEETESEFNQIRVRKNSVFVAHDFFLNRSINYERIFLTGERSGIATRIGFGNDYGNRNLNLIGEVAYLYGKTRHYLEAGAAYCQPFYFFDQPDKPAIAVMVGYRFVGRNGFLFKAYGEVMPDVFPAEDSWGTLPFLGLAIGYSFGKTGLAPAQ